MEELKRKENIVCRRAKSYQEQWNALDVFLKEYTNSNTEEERKVRSFVIRKNMNQLEILYCGKVYLIDFGVVLKENQFYICASSYKQIRYENFCTDKYKYQKVDNDLYASGGYIYQENNDEMMFIHEGFEEAIDGLIVNILHKAFD